ncbi:MAG: hypothetical protein ACOWYE_10905 [Desulfatiglandales bacterium]
MECPHCHEEIPTRACAHCSEETPLPGRYCMFCGKEFVEEADHNEASEQVDPFDLDNRVLCPDGTCTGIIVNGICTECGKHFEQRGTETQ